MSNGNKSGVAKSPFCRLPLFDLPAPVFGRHARGKRDAKSSEGVTVGIMEKQSAMRAAFCLSGSVRAQRFAKQNTIWYSRSARQIVLSCQRKPRKISRLLDRNLELVR